MREIIVACVQLCKEAGGSCSSAGSLWHVLRGAFTRGIITHDEWVQSENWFLDTLTENQQTEFLKSI